MWIRVSNFRKAVGLVSMALFDYVLHICVTTFFIWMSEVHLWKENAVILPFHDFLKKYCILCVHTFKERHPTNKMIKLKNWFWTDKTWMDKTIMNIQETTAGISYSKMPDSRDNSYKSSKV